MVPDCAALQRHQRRAGRCCGARACELSQTHATRRRTVDGVVRGVAQQREAHRSHQPREGARHQARRRRPALRRPQSARSPPAPAVPCLRPAAVRLASLQPDTRSGGRKATASRAGAPPAPTRLVTHLPQCLFRHAPAAVAKCRPSKARHLAAPCARCCLCAPLRFCRQMHRRQRGRCPGVARRRPRACCPSRPRRRLRAFRRAAACHTVGRAASVRRRHAWCACAARRLAAAALPQWTR